MAKDKDCVDTYNRGRTSGNRGGAGAYTESNSEAMRKKGLGDAARKVDRSDTPNEKPYGSMHYPAKGE
jgi:hypothetical protein